MAIERRRTLTRRDLAARRRVGVFVSGFVLRRVLSFFFLWSIDRGHTLLRHLRPGNNLCSPFSGRETDPPTAAVAAAAAAARWCAFRLSSRCSEVPVSQVLRLAATGFTSRSALRWSRSRAGLPESPTRREGIERCWCGSSTCHAAPQITV